MRTFPEAAMLSGETQITTANRYCIVTFRSTYPYGVVAGNRRHVSAFLERITKGKKIIAL
jgi:hypothetical protein